MLVEATIAAGLLLGQSVQGRPLRVERIGPADARRRVLVVGSIHGNETAGHAVVRALRRARPPAGVAVWIMTSANPDGVRRGRRQNAQGVDLNRNFPYRWRRSGRGTFYSGPRAASEPETRAAQRMVAAIRPHVTVWYHQQLRLVNLSDGADARIVRAYARRVGLPARRLPRYRGTATSWQNRTYRGTTAFVVELAAGRLSAAAVRRHVAAVHGAARASAAAAAAPRPRIIQTPIPFGAERKAQMRRYARRHYGLDTARLQPRQIVQHFTASSTFSSAFNTFAANARDPELDELPGVCAHFLIDRDGTIHQLVPLRYMCRHVIGLNHVAIGIEHVGTSDAQVMGNRPQLAASLRLARWLQSRHGIAVRDVIGHAESLSSRFHHERVSRLRNRTHGDFASATMRRYRARL